MTRVISLPDAGARLAEIAEEISATGEPVTVIHHGRPVLVLMRPDHVAAHPPADDLRWTSGDHVSEVEMLLDTMRATRA